MCDSTHMKRPEQANPQRQTWVPHCQGLRRGMGVTANGDGASFGDDKNVLKLTVVMAAQLCEYTKKY